jgi:hypothetical protein
MTQTTATNLVLFGMQIRAVGPYSSQGCQAESVLAGLSFFSADLHCCCGGRQADRQTVRQTDRQTDGTAASKLSRDSRSRKKKVSAAAPMAPWRLQAWRQQLIVSSVHSNEYVAARQRTDGRDRPGLHTASFAAGN